MKVGLVFALLLGLFIPSQLCAAESRRVNCGGYSLELPKGFELRMIEIDSPQFTPNLTLNQPFNQKDLSSAIVTCLREKKSTQADFALPAKEKVLLRIQPKRDTQMLITATENVSHENTQAKFSLLEEPITNKREIKGRERFMVSIEMSAAGEAWHTMIFVSDFRDFESFINPDEYRSKVTGLAIQVMDSIRKPMP